MDKKETLLARYVNMKAAAAVWKTSWWSSLPSTQLSELKDEKARMHIVHPSIFILQLTESAEIRELKDEKARKHVVHPSFFILQLTESAEISEALLRAFTKLF